MGAGEAAVREVAAGGGFVGDFSAEGAGAADDGFGAEVGGVVPEVVPAGEVAGGVGAFSPEAGFCVAGCEGEVGCVGAAGFAEGVGRLRFTGRRCKSTIGRVVAGRDVVEADAEAGADAAAEGDAEAEAGADVDTEEDAAADADAEASPVGVVSGAVEAAEAVLLTAAVGAVVLVAAGEAGETSPTDGETAGAAAAGLSAEVGSTTGLLGVTSATGAVGVTGATGVAGASTTD